MSWKPSRSSGLTYDKYERKARKYRKILDELLPQCNPPMFEDINKLSKAFYLYWLNDNKKAEALTGSKSLCKPFGKYCIDYYIRIFKNHPKLTYKPLLPVLQSIDV